MKYLIACLLWHSFEFTVPPTIKGIVKDKETNEPIPFAHVVVGDIVNISNIEGEFVISTSDLEGEDANLRISYMGYREYQRPLKELDAYQTIFLEPSVTHLGEVTVMTGPSLMEKVFDRFHINYQMERQHMIGYYRETMSNWTELCYVAEGIMDIYTPSNLDKTNYPMVSPLRTRKKVFKEIDAIDDILGGNASDMAYSSIWREDSFLSPKNRKNYDFFYAGATSIGNHSVYLVDFEPKSAKGNTHGKLYIEEESMAVLKIEYFPIIEDWTYWESVSWIEEYEQHDGIFEMVSVAFNGTSTNHEYEYKALLVINESRTISQLPLDTQMLDHKDSFFHEAKEDFADTFWSGFNFMKLDSKVTQLLDKKVASGY